MKRSGIGLWVIATAACGGLTGASHSNVDPSLEAGIAAGSDGGGWTGLGDADASTSADANATADADIDVGPPVLCDSGDYFIEVVEDGGTWRATDNCWDSGPPELLYSVCGEDILCWEVAGCGGGRSITLSNFLVPISLGSTPARIYAQDSDGGLLFLVNGEWRITALPPPGGTVAGDYSTLDASADGPIHGTFCVLRN